jgi:uncharacterized membrane protein
MEEHFANSAGKWASTRSAKIQIPGLGGTDLKLDSRNLSLTTILGALYASLVIAQGYSAAATIQLRLADSLIALSALFGWPAIIGVSLGSVVSNTFTSSWLPYGGLDIVLGPLANFTAGLLIYLFRKNRFLGCILGAIDVGIIVGSYVWLIFGPPSSIFGFSMQITLPIWMISIVSVTLSSLLAIAVLGYALLRTLSRTGIAESFMSHKTTEQSEHPQSANFSHETGKPSQTYDLLKIQTKRIENLIKRRP